MFTIRKYYPAFASALLMLLILFVIYPHLQYYIDPDATAYLTISQRYANGDFEKAINGYWSPWSCWLTALFIKKGCAAFPSAILVNAIAAVGFLLVSQSLFLLFPIERRLQWLLNGTLAVFLSYAVFKQTFADLWECFFLLTSLRIMLSNLYSTKPFLWVLNGVIGALAYFAKAYSFPFFILNTICCSFAIAHAKDIANRMAWVKMSIVAIGVMSVCSSPWIYLLHEKYGIWTTSTAGALNRSWYLVGHPEFKYEYLLPPVYPDSVYYWEDPWWANGATLQMWDSLRLFILQIVKCCYNLLKFVNSANEISSFFLLIWLLAVCIVASKKVRYFFEERSMVLAISFLLFPLGFVLINFEARYIWYMLPLSMVIGALSLQRVFLLSASKRLLTGLIAGVFAISYLVWPLWDMKGLLNEGRNDFETAKKMKSLGVQGSFASNASFGNKTQQAARIAYFSGNTYYNTPFADTPYPQLLTALRQYKVRYYVYFNDGMAGIDHQMLDEQGRVFPEVSKGAIKGLKIFQLSR